MSEGMLFHSSGAAFEKARLPYDFSLKEPLVKRLDDLDLRERGGTYGFTSSLRYEGAQSFKALKVSKSILYSMNMVTNLNNHCSLTSLMFI